MLHIYTGKLPLSLAKLVDLEVLDLDSNDLLGFLPAHMGSASCLPSLKTLSVQDNTQLGGVIDAHFLANSNECITDGCHPTLQFPFLSGASLSSVCIQMIFSEAPKVVVSEERAQGKVTFLYPMGSPNNTGTEQQQGEMHQQYLKYTQHLQELWREQGEEGGFEEWLAVNNSKWCLWQETWLSELRQLHVGHLFVFVSPERYMENDSDEEETVEERSFETKFKSKMYTDGKVDDREWSAKKGSFLSGSGWCKAQVNKISQYRWILHNDMYVAVIAHTYPFLHVNPRLSILASVLTTRAGAFRRM
jgi:hypothetical protein